MKLFNSNAVAKMIGISNSTFSSWMKNHKDELIDNNYIITKGKYIYYHPEIIKQICTLRRTPIPDEIEAALQNINSIDKIQELKNTFQITNLEDALMVAYKYKQEAEKLKEQNIMLTAKIETMKQDMVIIRDMHNKAMESTKILLENLQTIKIDI